MWVIRFLSGPQAGQIYQLNEGSNIIGRQPGCDVILTSRGVSKQHAKIEIFGDKVIITDLNSFNGTFVNGIKIQSIQLKGEEKLALHENLFDIIKMPASSFASPQSEYPNQATGLGYDGNVAHNYSPNSIHQQEEQQNIPNAQFSAQQVSPQSLSKQTILTLIQKYIEEVALPGVYKLPEIMEFRWVLFLFMGAFILFVTSLSSVPLVRILKASIEKESQRRALTIARTLAQVSRAPLIQGVDSAISVEIARREPGVEKALVIDSMDGNIKAPASQAGKIPNLPFVHSARQEGKEVVSQINDNTIGALVPIKFFNSDTGSEAILAYAVIIYNMGSSTVGDARTLSLFIQTFFIALIVGSILFFFLYKIIEYPLDRLNVQLDRALKENREDLNITYQFPVLQKLVFNINSTLSRIGSGDDMGSNQQIEYDRSSELNNLVQIIGFGCLGITAHDNTIQAVNAEFEEKTGIHAQDLVYQTVDKINDQALSLSITDLIERSSQTPHQIATNDLEIGGDNYEIAVQAIHGTQNISYYLITLLPTQMEHEV